MIVKQFVKKLNNTELGFTGHDKYVVIPSKVNALDMFEYDMPIYIRDRKSDEVYFGNKYNIKLILARNNQNRISGVGFYWKKYNVSAGDEIIFEKHEGVNESVYFIDICLYNDIVLLQRGTNGFQILNMDRLKDLIVDGEYKLKVKYNHKESDLTLRINLKGVKDGNGKTSKEEMDRCDLIIDGTSILEQFKNNEYIELSIAQGDCRLKKVNMWRKTTIEWED